MNDSGILKCGWATEKDVDENAIPCDKVAVCIVHAYRWCGHYFRVIPSCQECFVKYIPNGEQAASNTQSECLACGVESFMTLDYNRRIVRIES